MLICWWLWNAGRAWARGELRQSPVRAELVSPIVLSLLKEASAYGRLAFLIIVSLSKDGLMTLGHFDKLSANGLGCARKTKKPPFGLSLYLRSS